MNRRHYHEHRIPTSLQRHVGESPTDPHVVEALVRKARQAGVIVFLKPELDRMPSFVREFIEREHQTLRDRRGG